MFAQVYAHYLMNGGNPKDFLRLNYKDVQLMYIVENAENVQKMNTIIKAIAGIFGATEV